jgi:hypothetical protein
MTINHGTHGITRKMILTLPCDSVSFVVLKFSGSLNRGSQGKHGFRQAEPDLPAVPPFNGFSAVDCCQRFEDRGIDVLADETG